MTTWICPKCHNVMTSSVHVREVAHKCPANDNKITNYEEKDK